MAPSILWFRRDLRLGDHPALHEAIRRSGGEGVVPLFVVDETFLGPSGPTRVEFLIGCLEALSESMGVPLTLRSGDPATVVPALAKEIGARSVLVTGDFAPEGLARDARVASALQDQGAELISMSSPYAVEPGTVRSEKDLPLKVFSAYRRRWEVRGPHVVLGVPDVKWLEAPSDTEYEVMRRLGGTRRPLLFGDLPDGPPATLPQPGENAALAILEEFIDDRVDDYGEGRDILERNGTSGLGPYLRFGCIHPRTVLAAAQGAGGGRATFRSEICWREFYADVLFTAPHSVRDALQPQMAGLEWDGGERAEERFRCWARGETGIPLVDAAMRQLLKEGTMHNRARMVSASFLIKHLHLDWRWGARWFMWRLVDGDLASNQQGWQWTAGTGTDAAPFHRIFNPVAQAQRFDPNGAYIHRYVEELAGIPAPDVLQPGGGVGLLHQSSYPAPLVDLKAEREEALRRYAAARDAYRATTT